VFTDGRHRPDQVGRSWPYGNGPSRTAANETELRRRGPQWTVGL